MRALPFTVESSALMRATELFAELEAKLKARDPDEGVVVALYREGERAVGRATDQHLNLAGGIGPHPDSGVAGYSIAE